MKSGTGGGDHYTCEDSVDASGVRIKVDPLTLTADVLVCLGTCNAADEEHFVHLYFE
jgi:hypothetical protein